MDVIRSSAVAVTHQLEGGLTSCGGELGFVDASTAEVHYLKYLITWSMMQHRPLVADTTKWCDVSIREAQIVITGGFNAKGELADSIQYKCADNVTHTFVALHKEAQWFVKGVGGARKGELKAVNVLAMIRQKANEADYETIDAETSPAVAGSDSQDGADDDYDPMDEMIALDSVADAVIAPSKKKRKVDRASLQELQVPTRPPCVGTASQGETTIFVYTPSGRKNRVPHLRVDCIPWLLAYAADELACQGVSCGDATSDCTPQKANCEIENVHLEWDFASKVWDATFVGGHAQGECLQFGPTDVTPALLKHLRSLELANGWYSKSSSSSNKSAAKEYVLIWCKAVHEMRIAEHNATFKGLLSHDFKQRGGTNADDGEGGADDAGDGEDDADDADDAEALAAEGADDGDAPAAESASEDEASDADAADVSTACA